MTKRKTTRKPKAPKQAPAANKGAASKTAKPAAESTGEPDPATKPAQPERFESHYHGPRLLPQPATDQQEPAAAGGAVSDANTTESGTKTSEPQNPATAQSGNYPQVSTAKAHTDKDDAQTEQANAKIAQSETQTEKQETQTEKQEKGVVTSSDCVPAASGSPPTLTLAREESQGEATRRWMSEGVSEQVAAFRDRVRGEYIESHPGCKRRDAHEHAWHCALAQFPPVGVEPSEGPPMPEPPPPMPEPEPEAPEPVEVFPEPVESGLVGLAAIPASWPGLPVSASLAEEVQWVQSSRIDVAEKLPGGGIRVCLDRADHPAPSKSALSWLETSLLFPAKFADVAVKVTSGQEDERDHVRREQLALEDTRAVLAEMAEAEPPPP